MWVRRELLLRMVLKLVQRHDEKEAVAAGLASKTLTAKDVEEHLEILELIKKSFAYTN